MKNLENKTRFATSFSRIEEIVKKITDIDYSKKDGESTELYKKRVENLYLPLISKLEGVKLEWLVPDFSDLPQELRPENIGEEVIHINIFESPIRDLINSVMCLLSVKPKQNLD